MGYLILSQFLMVAYLFVVDRYCLKWHTPFGESISLCAFECDVISNFIWFVMYFTINQHKFLVSCFFCSVFYKTKLVANVYEKFHLLWFFIPIFIHKYHSSMTCGKTFFHVTKYSILGVTKYYFKYLVHVGRIFKKRFGPAPLLMFTCSCSCLQAQEITSLCMFPHLNLSFYSCNMWVIIF
jgi:hypothetical protein